MPSTRASRTSGSGCSDPNYRPLASAARGTTELRPPGAEAALADITRDPKAFAALVRTRIFTFLRAWSIGDHARALEGLDPALQSDDVVAWDINRLKASLDAWNSEHTQLRFDPEARNLRHTHIKVADDGLSWRVQQVLVDAEQEFDWMADIHVDLPASTDANRPVLWLRALGPVADSQP